MAQDWDAFCELSQSATFQHTRKFLSYHGQRFQDVSLLVIVDGEISAIFPAALDPQDSGWVISHPGAAFGSLITSSQSRGKVALDATPLIIEKYKELGMKKLSVREIPNFYNRVPRDEFAFTLYAQGGFIEAVKLSSTIDLQNKNSLSSRRKRALSRNIPDLQIVNDSSYLANFWEVLEENLLSRHGSKPVHDLREIQFLAKEFPDLIQLWCAIDSNGILGGVLLFNSSQVWHCQYIGTSDVGRELNVLDFVFQEIITSARIKGLRYFDFGTSNLSDWRFLSRGLFEFKSEFGGTGALYTQISINLTDLEPPNEEKSVNAP